ncbi:MAG: glutathione S-transferase family protein [Alphaproteobacteria bacterium]|nr:glutathione S-transferase family protein [Alphaproteobacteria bacterium]
MNKVTIYGIPMSRAFRAMWACKELGIDFDNVKIGFADGSNKTAEYLAVNPNGRVPALKDGNLTLFESLAICLYLAKKQGGPLYPKTLEGEALTWQWTLWSVNELEKHLVPIFLHSRILPEDKRNPAVVAEAKEAIKQPLGVLNAHLAKSNYLLGDAFTIADLNLAGVMLTTVTQKLIDIAPYPQIDAWVKRITARPALAEAMKLRQA